MSTLEISDLLFPAFNKGQLKTLPLSYGLEFFNEFGTQDYWSQLLPQFSINKRDISLHGPCVTANLANPEDTQYLKQLKDTLLFGKEINAKFIVIHTNERWQGDRLDCQKLVIQRLQEIATFNHSINRPIMAVENVGLHQNNLFNEEEYLNLFNTIPHIQSIIDVGHAHVNNWDLSNVIKTLNSQIIAFHLHDNDGNYDQHYPINAGTINWPDLFKTINTYSPKAIKVLEYANGSFTDSTQLLKHIESIQELLTLK